MLKKVTVAIAALAAVGFAGAAMAETNPWHPGQTKVPVKITVETIAEVWVDKDAPRVDLKIQNGGTNHGYRNAVTRDVYLSNTSLQVAASIANGDIPNNSNFIVLVNPSARAWELVDRSRRQQGSSLDEGQRRLHRWCAQHASACVQRAGHSECRQDDSSVFRLFRRPAEPGSWPAYLRCDLDSRHRQLRF